MNDINAKYHVSISDKNTHIDIIKLYPKELISHGYSGSPVICQESNAVIGIVILTEGGNNYAIHVKHLLAIHNINTELNNNKINQKISKLSLSSSIDRETHTFISKTFEKNLKTALGAFSTQPRLWIEPRICDREEATSGSNKTGEFSRINIIELINNPKSIIIKARQQFGLTSLSHYLVKEAWTNETPAFWLYIDAGKIKPFSKDIDKYTKDQLVDIGLKFEDIECIVLDGFSGNLNKANEILNKVSEFFKGKHIILMLTITESLFPTESILIPDNREFHKLYLWSLPRNDIRNVVKRYNDERYIRDENIVFEKVLSDLDVLNIPRTPLNCLTILKISEVGFDDSPVNRAEMINRVLFLLFNVDDIPRYKSRPDLKDTEYVLGFFCEFLFKRGGYYFSRLTFINKLDEFCKQREIDLDLDVIFDILYDNSIIVHYDQEFCFRYAAIPGQPATRIWQGFQNLIAVQIFH